MRRSGVVRRRGGRFVALGALVVALCGAAVPQPAQAQSIEGAVSGTVTSSSGTPLAGVTVELYLGTSSLGSGTSFGYSATTAADGTYTISNVLAGSSFSVGFTDAGYIPQWWNNKPSAATADPVTITADQTTTGIDAVLQPETTTGSITGHVTDAATTKPLTEPVEVTATNTSTTQVTQTWVDAAGAYQFVGLSPGAYTVYFSAAGYVSPQWWNNKTSQAEADQVTVTAGQITSGIDAALVPIPTGSISGTVTNSSGQPVSGATVTANVIPSGAVGSATTAADGTYTITGLAPGGPPLGYLVSFSAPGYVTQWWNGTVIQDEATPVAVVAGQATTGINAALASNATTGVVAGKVTNPDLQSIASATVVATNVTTGEATTVQTDAKGYYAFVGLAPGTYSLEFSAPGYVTQTPTNQVTITAGQTVTNADVSLAPSSPAAISGTVTNSSGQPVAGATVGAVCNQTQQVSATTAADGTYTLNGIFASTGATCTLTFTANGYAEQVWNDKSLGAQGDPVSVTAGQTTTGIDAALQPLPPLSGLVFGNGSSFGALAGATVVVHNYFGFTVAQTTTDAGGGFSFPNLHGGAYRVEFQPPAGSGLLGQWWNDEPDGAHSDVVDVAAGAPASNIDAVLTPGASVAGTVTDAAGPVAGATVGIFVTPPLGLPSFEVAHTTTAADGTYNVSSLQPGNYDVLFDPPAGSSDVGQWYNNSPTAGGATNVTLAASDSATANAQLTTGQRGSISGTVADQSGSPIAGATVFAVAADGRTTTTATTAADGTYTIDNVGIGIDTVWFGPPAGSSYRGTVWNLAAGKLVPLTVDQGSVITGIDATLVQNGT